jgi:serine/threonine protein kinase
LLKADITRADVRHRFLHERQVLADLNHPNIARLLDGGTAEDGRPYIVLEYIEGRPIDDYCQQQQLSLNERLQLFRQVCTAVQYAHQHLLIHRDLKPANVLVTSDGVPKLLDFGIAKLLQPDLAQSFETLPGTQPMTPAYASPEQVRGEKLTTASDVYSLGVLLYELLTGRSPYQLTTSNFGELVKAICEQEPLKSSTGETQRRKDREMERRGDGNVVSLSLRLSVSPSQLRGDLDSIVLMALRKEPAARYGSVEQFAEDIRRYLAGLPTTARRGTFGYRAVK